MLYSVVGSFPLFFVGGYAIRIQDDLAVSRSRFGLAVSAYFAASALGSLAIGAWIDRSGARSGFVSAGIGAAVAALLISASGSIATLAAALGLAGLANTAGHLGSNRLLAGVGDDRQGLGFGVKQAAVPLGGLCAGLTVATIGLDVDWRAAFIGYAVLASAFAVVAPHADGPATTDRNRRPIGGDRRFLATLAAAGALAGATGNGLAVLAVDAFGAAGYSEGVGATALALGSAVAIAGRIALGWTAGRGDGRGFAELGWAMAVGALGFGLLAVADSRPVLLWVGMLVAFVGAWGWPGVMYYAVVRNATTAPGTATGIVVAGVFIGGITGTPLLAWIADRRSYDSAWAVAACTTLLAVVLVVAAAHLSTPHRSRTTAPTGSGAAP